MDVFPAKLCFQLFTDKRDGLVQDTQSPVLLIHAFLLLFHLLCKVCILMHPVMALVTQSCNVPYGVGTVS